MLQLSYPSSPNLKTREISDPNNQGCHGHVGSCCCLHCNSWTALGGDKASGASFRCDPILGGEIYFVCNKRLG